MLLVYAIYIAASFLGTVTSQSCSNPDADVLILGAGIAGISAARTLNDNGITNVILEALPDIGGRIRQGELSSGVKIELGANWIQLVSDVNAHPIFDILLSCELDLENVLTDYDDLTLCDTQGNEIDTDLLDANNAQFLQSLHSAYELVESRIERGLPDISLREGIRLVNNNSATDAQWKPDTPLRKFVEWLNFDFTFGEPPDKSSFFYMANHFLNQPPYLKDYFVTDQQGFSQVVKCLADNFVDGQLHLNTTVNQVQWNNDCVCASVTENGASNMYCAPYAIITFSIGVLQSEFVQFEPPLPLWKRDVINMFSMVHYLKIFVEFDTAFWNNRTSSQFVGYITGERGNFSLLQNLDKLIGKNVVLATLTDELADRFIRLDEETRKQELMQVFRNIYGPNVPDPTHIVIPDWDVNPLFLGTYSNTPPGVSTYTMAFKNLSAPLGRLYFSGEATHAEFTGFVQGGYLAGNDSAYAVIHAALLIKLKSTGCIWIGTYAIIICLGLLLLINLLQHHNNQQASTT